MRPGPDLVHPAPVNFISSPSLRDGEGDQLLAMNGRMSRTGCTVRAVHCSGRGNSCRLLEVGGLAVPSTSLKSLIL
jgi:hypothetical protein